MNEAQAGWSGFAIVEMFGHKRIAGFVASEVIGGASFIRLDVPATEESPRGNATKGYSKFLGPASIYAITPVDEEVAKRVAHEIERYNDPLPVSLPAIAATSSGREIAQAELDEDAEDGDLFDDDDA